MNLISSYTHPAMRREDARKPLGRGTRSPKPATQEHVCSVGAAGAGMRPRGMGLDPGDPTGSHHFKEPQLNPRRSRETSGQHGPNGTLFSGKPQ